MRFLILQERLRRFLLARIGAGQLSGLQLAQQTGFQQAHICNFLNHKRGLSLEGMDRVLAVQQLSVLDLLEPGELAQRGKGSAGQDADFDNVLLVDAVAAAEPIIISGQVRDVLKFKKNFLRRLRPEMDGPRDDWHRFVLIKAGARDGMSMYPRMTPGATLLLDRHYNSLKPYRRGDANMYAVRKDGGCTVKYVELAASHLVLRPHNQSYPVELLPLADPRRYAEAIIGRVCHVGIET